MSVSLDITYFLKLDVWFEYGFTNKNTDTKKLMPIIASVQRKEIKPVIGSLLYDKLVTDIKAGTVTGLYETLLKKYIIPTMICYCDAKAVVHTTSQITNKTTGKNRDEHIEPNDITENNLLVRELLGDADAHKQDMKRWLCDNWEDIPELYESPDEDLRAQTLPPKLSDDNDLNGMISII